MCHLYKFVRSSIDFPNAPLVYRPCTNHLTRYTHPFTLLQPPTRTNSFYFSIFSHAVAVWNTLPFSVVSSNNISIYCTAQKFRGSKFSRIAVFENLVEIISRIHCPKHATPTLFMGVTCWNSIARTLELSFIDLAAAVNTRNQEGMRALLEDPAT